MFIDDEQINDLDVVVDVVASTGMPVLIGDPPKVAVIAFEDFVALEHRKRRDWLRKSRIHGHLLIWH